MSTARTFATFSVIGIIAACSGSSTFGGVADAGPGCEKDTDCKGERVCRDRQCVDEGDEAERDASSSDASAKKDGKASGDAGAGKDGGDEDPLAGCSVVNVATERNPVILEIVLDGSGSMDSDNKWSAASQALNAFFDELTQANAPDLAVGLMIYEDANDPTAGQGPYPTAIDVYPQPVAAAHGAKLKARISNTTASGGTPTAIALQGAYAMLTTYAPPSGATALAGARKAVVLISDGVPNGGTTEQSDCIQKAKNAFSLGAPQGPILTFAVGVGPFPGTAFTYEPKFMGDIAVAGGTRAFPQCDPAATNVANVCHVQITPGGASAQVLAQEFLKAVRRVRSNVAGCELKVTAPANTYDPSRVKLSFKDGAGALTVVPRSTSDGWEFDDPNDPTAIHFDGTSCADLGGAVEVKVEACEP